MTSDMFFGKYLKLNVDRLCERHRDELRAVLHDCGTDITALNQIAAGHKLSIKLDLLFRLTALTNAYLSAPFVDVAESLVWKTFRERKRGIVLSPSDSGDKSRKFIGRLEHALDADLQHEPSQAPVDQAALRTLMQTENVLIIGSGLKNVATEWALKLLWDDDPIIAFRHPDHQAQMGRRTVQPSADGLKGLRVRSKNGDEPAASFTEPLPGPSGRPSRMVGAVVVARHPFGAPDVTTIIVAGCSRHGTREMADRLQEPQFYEAFATADPQGPTLLLFDSSRKRHRFKVHGLDRNKGGRPKKNPK